METMFQDVRYALRSLIRQRGFSVFAVLTLGLGIGANTAVFSMINAVLLRPLALREPDRVVSVWEGRREIGQYPISIPDFLDLQTRQQTLSHLAALANWSANLSGEETPERVTGIQASGEFFATLGAHAEYGRLLLPEDAQPGGRRVAVLSHGFWKRHYAGDPAVIGRGIRLNGQLYAVVGIAPPDLTYRQLQDDVIVPLVFEQDPRRTERNNNFLRGFGRMKPGITARQASDDLTRVVRALSQEYPDSDAGKTGARVEALQSAIVGDAGRSLLLLLCAVLTLLLIACANLAGLLLVRASTRSREVAIRVSVGATRSRLLRQLLTENMVLAAAGGALGLVLAAAGVRGLLLLTPTALPRAGEIGLDVRVLGFNLLVSVLCGVIFGSAPALEISRVNLNEEMKGAVRGGARGGVRLGLQQILVMTQVAASLVLLVGSGLLLKSFLRLSEVRPGFNPGNLLVVRLALPKTQYKGNEEVFHFYHALAARAENLPGVKSLAVANVVPIDGFLATVEFSIAGRGWTAAQLPAAHYRMVTPAYFRTLQIPVLAGREFTESDNAQGAPVAIINETFARKYWPGQSALGEHLQMDDVQTGMRDVEIVGVAGDIHDFGLEHEPQAEVYAPIAQVPPGTIDYLKSNMYWFLRTEKDPLTLAAVFRREVQAVDRDVPATSMRSLEQYLEQSLAPRRFNLVLVAAFGTAALLIASMGIYGVISYFVVLRTREIGIRLALGAQREEVFRLILGQGLRLVITGVCAGLLAALALARTMASLLFGTSAADPGTYCGITLLLVGVAALACYVPGRRAMSVDPLVALHHE